MLKEKLPSSRVSVQTGVTGLNPQQPQDQIYSCKLNPIKIPHLPNDVSQALRTRWGSLKSFKGTISLKMVPVLKFQKKRTFQKHSKYTRNPKFVFQGVCCIQEGSRKILIISWTLWVRLRNIHRTREREVSSSAKSFRNFCCTREGSRCSSDEQQGFSLRQRDRNTPRTGNFPDYQDTSETGGLRGRPGGNRGDRGTIQRPSDAF